MSFISGCFLFIDGAFAVLFFILFEWVGWDKVAFIGAGIIAIPIWISLIRYERREAREEEQKRIKDEREKEIERERQEEIEREDRKRRREIARQNTACFFQDGISRLEFETLAHHIAKRIKRLEVTVNGPVVIGTVESQSGISTWQFKADFNDFGHITGSWWITQRENYDSNIPNRYAELMSGAIREKLNDH